MDCVRPSRMMRDADASENDLAMERPMPAEAPVMRIVRLVCALRAFADEIAG